MTHIQPHRVPTDRPNWHGSLTLTAEGLELETGDPYYCTRVTDFRALRELRDRLNDVLSARACTAYLHGTGITCLEDHAHVAAGTPHRGEARAPYPNTPLAVPQTVPVTWSHQEPAT